VRLFEIRELTVRRRAKTILQDVGLVIDAGQITAVLGPSGSGTSTLLRVLAGSPGRGLRLEGTILYRGADQHSSPDRLPVARGRRELEQALTGEPEVILFDEPPPSLEPKLRELSGEITIVIGTHDIQQAARLADRIVILDSGGRVLEQGATASLFVAPTDDRVEAYLSARFGPADSAREELERLEASLQEESGLVLRALHGALDSLGQRDVELADVVIAADDEIDRRHREIAQGLQALLARQAPVATDLRLVLALLHVNLHLERMADYSVTIAKLTKLVADVAGDPALLQSLQEMGERAEEMIRVALDALANRDLQAAESLVDLDELIDRSNRRFVERVVEIVAEPGLREWVLRMVLVSRTIERIGDHAVDIGEQVAYLLTTEFKEFTDASHPEGTEGEAEGRLGPTLR
jgi:phosphate transport system protein